MKHVTVVTVTPIAPNAIVGAFNNLRKVRATTDTLQGHTIACQRARER
jgi:hypothetical protein